MNPDTPPSGARMGRLSALGHDSAQDADSHADSRTDSRGTTRAPVSRMPDLPPDFGPVRAPAQAERIRVRFNGRGGEYFRIWTVNLLLMLVTFGIYYPWAKVRKLRYFHGHTEIGSHALDFHGEPRKMLRGTLLVGLLFALYSAAGQVSTTAGLVALGILSVIWPALWRASLQFRFGQTSWRGLRMDFLGSMKAAYLALGLPSLVILGLIGGGVALSEAQSAGLPEGVKPPASVLVPMIAGLLAALALVPWLWFRVKRFQQGHMAYGSVRTEFRGSLGAIYGVFLRTALVSLVPLAVVIAAGGLMFVSMRGGDPRGALSVLPLLMVILAVVAQMVPRAYFNSRMQNLLWSRTGNRVLRFKSDLAFLPLWGLMVKNTVLVALTLGLYWPWAAIALARRRLESVTLVTRVSLDQIAAAASQRQAGDAAGEAAADLFGVDFGL